MLPLNWKCGFKFPENILIDDHYKKEAAASYPERSK